MSIELQYLVFAVFLLLLQLVLQVMAGFLTRGFTGVIAGPKDDDEIDDGMLGRVEHAFYNMLETFPIFATLVLAVHVTESFTPLTALAAQIYFWGRVVYLPVYIMGIPFLRTLIWLIASAGIVLLAWPLLMQVV